MTHEAFRDPEAIDVTPGQMADDDIVARRFAGIDAAIAATEAAPAPSGVDAGITDADVAAARAGIARALAASEDHTA
ncbi:hypothetical protein AB0M28_05305 [Streptomyces sp. NPDC051940]|uniref:hypothetical protein n=1 Tax=Streptomyces sp. NPDC051940 TaxID=3155675 RepID=UPI00341B1576